MEIELTEDRKAFVQQGIESGRYRDAESAIRNALALWEGTVIIHKSEVVTLHVLRGARDIPAALQHLF